MTTAATSRRRLRFSDCCVRLFVTGSLLLGSGGCSTHEGVVDAEGSVRAAWESYRLGDYDRAISTFRRVAGLPDVDAELRLRAMFGEATTWNLRQPVLSQDDARAALLYGQVIERAPDHDLAAWSALALARMKHLVPVGEEPDYDAVRAAYQEVIDRFGAHIAAQEALIYQQSTLVMSLDTNATEHAVARLRRFLDEQPDAAFASAAYALLAEAYQTLGRPGLQLDARLRELETLEVDPASPASADLSWRYWQIATTAEFLAGRFDIARTFYRRLIDEYPLDFRKFGARQALARMERVERDALEGGAP